MLNARLIKLHPKKRLETCLLESKIQKKQLEQFSRDCLQTKRKSLEFNEHRLQNSSIQSSLKRGYVILKDKQDKVLDNLQMAQKSDEIKACFIDGELELLKKVKKMEKWKKFKTRYSHLYDDLFIG